MRLMVRRDGKAAAAFEIKSNCETLYGPVCTPEEEDEKKTRKVIIIYTSLPPPSGV